MSIEMLSKPVPHDIPEYLKIVWLGAGGAALGAQITIRKINPQTVSLVVRRFLEAINIKCPDRIGRCCAFSLRSAAWIKANDGSIVPAVGLIAGAYKSSVDSREQKIKEAKAEIETKIKDEKIKELYQKVKDFEEKIRVKDSLIEVLNTKVTESKMERSLDQVEPSVDHKSLAILEAAKVQDEPKTELKMKRSLDKLAPCIHPKPFTILEAASKAAKVQGASWKDMRSYQEKLKPAVIKLE